MLTTSLFLLYLSFKQAPPKPQQQPPVVADAPLGQDGNPLFQQGGNTEHAELRAAEPAANEVAAEAFPAQFVTLGSMDPAKKFNLLITLTTQGASIDRAELVGHKSPNKLRYIALEHNAGYLGYLGLVEVPEGLRVRSVPDGSPAALAKSPGAEGGLRPGDVIAELDGNANLSVHNFEAALRKTRPKDDLEFKVLRGDQRLDFKATLSQAPLDLLRTQPFSSELVVGNEELASLRTTIASINTTRIPVGKMSLPALQPTFDLDWRVVPLQVAGGEGVEFRLPLKDLLKGTDYANLELVKRYRLMPETDTNDGYLLDFEVLVENQNDKPVSIALRQEGPTDLSLEGWWYSVKISQSFFAGAGQRDIAYANRSGVHLLKATREIFSHGSSNPTQPHTILFSEGEPLESRSLNYIGLDSQYFNASILPHPESPDSLSDLAGAGARIAGDLTKIDKSQIQAANVAFWFDTKERAIEPGKSQSQRFSIFLGPKDPDVLAKHGLERTIEYGWIPWIAKPLGSLLHFFHAIVRNYGLAIIMLTICVRLCMFPLGRRAAITAQRMQELQPELKKINDKYPNDMEKRARAMQELYRKHEFRPLAGCLPMFIQLPIFIGLYRCLSVDISLRQEPLIPGLTWCSNLAGPDQFYDWSSWMWEYFSGRGTGWLGPYFNLLPLVTTVLFLVQQVMFMPKSTDPQQQMAQSMMKYMTIFMGVIFFKVPAGLCIYFITSSIWSIFERQLVKRTIPPPKTLGSIDTTKPTPEALPGSSNRTNPKDSGPQPAGRFDQWKKLLEKPAVRSATQRGTKKRKGK